MCIYVYIHFWCIYTCILVKTKCISQLVLAGSGSPAGPLFIPQFDTQFVTQFQVASRLSGTSAALNAACDAVVARDVA